MIITSIGKHHNYVQFQKLKVLIMKLQVLYKVKTAMNIMCSAKNVIDSC